MKLKTLILALIGTVAQAQVHVFESDANGFNTKNFFYDNGREVVAFDAQFTPELARKSIEFLRTKTQSPIRYLVITHPNPDKFNGAPVFRQLGAKVVASRRTVEAMKGVHEYKKYFFVNIAKMFTEATYPELPTVDLTFGETLTLGDVRLRELAKPGISGNQTVAYVRKERALFVGDLVHHKVHAWLEGGIVNGKATPTLNGWIRDLREIRRRYPFATVYGGRGEAANVWIAATRQISYLRKADSLVGAYVAGLGGREPDYKALQEVFERAFPGYGLGYLIQYGAYGLVGTKK